MPRHFQPFAPGLVLFGLLISSVPASAQSTSSASAPRTYVAVGDSVAFGYMNPTLTPAPPATAGYAGYAQPYASFLGAQLVNLGIVGETTSSLRANAAGNGLLNSNYSPTAPLTQYAQLSSDLAALGGSVSNITVQVGANDILALATSSAFQFAVASGDTATQQALLGGTLATVGANYDALLGQVHALAPQANVQVLGYYNPYAALPPTSPINVYLRSVSAPLNIALNGVLAQEAASHGDRFVDLYTPFLGQESTLTLSGETIPSAFGPVPNDHPTAVGYAVITRQLEADPVPEASTTVSFALLLALGAGAWTVRRKTKA